MPQLSLATRLSAAALCSLLIFTSTDSRASAWGDLKPAEETPKEEHSCNYPPKTAADKDGWISLFNSKDLTGWKVIPGHKSEFGVNDKGELTIKNGNGDIQSESQWDDFALQIDVFSNGPHLNSGVSKSFSARTTLFGCG